MKYQSQLQAGEGHRGAIPKEKANRLLGRLRGKVLTKNRGTEIFKGEE